MEKNNKKNVGAKNSSLDHLFGPKDQHSSPNSTGMFSSIFPPPSTVLAMEQKRIRDLGKQENFYKGGKGESSSSGVTSKDSNNNMIYQTETTFSSSIHYGGQENYSSTTTHQSHNNNISVKKDGNDDDPNANSASRGNWWQGSLYY